MSREQRIDGLLQRFEEQVWHLPAEDLAPLEPPTLAECRAIPFEFRELLRRQSDETLALGVRKGFFLKPAFEELLVTRFQARLLYWFGKWGTEANRAFDLAQETHLKLYRNRLGRYDPAQGSVRSYLRAVARSVWIEKEAKPRKLPLVEDPDLCPSRYGSAEDEVLARELQNRLKDAEAKLSSDHRDVWDLTLRDHSPAEIAEQLGVPIRRVYKCARRRLAQSGSVQRAGVAAARAAWPSAGRCAARPATVPPGRV